MAWSRISLAFINCLIMIQADPLQGNIMGGWTILSLSTVYDFFSTKTRHTRTAGRKLNECSRILATIYVILFASCLFNSASSILQTLHGEVYLSTVGILLKYVWLKWTFITLPTLMIFEENLIQNDSKVKILKRRSEVSG